MPARVEFTIPGRPAAWQRTGYNPGADGLGARRFTPHKHRKAMVAVQKAYRAQALADRRNSLLLTGPIKLEVLCVYGVPVSWSKAKRSAALGGRVWRTSVPDCDNLGKLVSDALNGHAYADDAMVAVLTVAKRYGEPERTVIRLTELPSLDAALPATELPDRQGKLAV